MTDPLRRWLSRFRFWLIRVLAGDNAVLVGFEVHGLTVVTGDAYVANCRFTHASNSSIRAMSRHEVRGLKAKLSAELEKERT